MIERKLDVVATGLFTLDFIFPPNDVAQFGLGGSCANVVSVLSALGQKCGVIGQVGNDEAGLLVKAELEARSIDCSLLSRVEGSTPIITQRFLDNGAGWSHVFEFKSPLSKRPRKPTHLNQLDLMDDSVKLPAAKVFYADRLTQSSLALAEKYFLEGALVVIELSDTPARELLLQVSRFAHVIKASSDHVPINSDYWLSAISSVVIVTEGDKGVCFRLSATNRGAGAEWQSLPAEKPAIVRDAAGAGDWLTAILINELLNRPAFIPLSSKKTLSQVLQHAQKVAARSCEFIGAQGMLGEDGYKKGDANRKSVISVPPLHPMTAEVLKRVDA